jgi:hypothetical protein
MLLLANGAAQPRVYSTFANQAYLAAADKADPMPEARAIHTAAGLRPWGPGIQA